MRNGLSTGRSHVVIGAGPAGLTAAWELTRQGEDVVVLEADREYVGGLSRTVTHEGNRFDLGGHRFYTKSPQVAALWREMLPNDFLEVSRLSRIFYEGRFFDYPLDLSQAMRQLGALRSARVVTSYAVAVARPRTPEASFEDWMVNRFGRHLYEMFFRTYTEKVWGMPCSEIDKDWAAQRIRGLDLRRSLQDALMRRTTETTVKTLITSFVYPRLGPGQLWEAVRDSVVGAGGRIVHGQRAVRVVHDGGRACYVETDEGQHHDGTDLYSSMPLRDLIAALDPAPPPPVKWAASQLRFRDFLTVAVVVDRPHVFPDNWIYVHDPAVHVGRIQNYKNWSSAMVTNQAQTCLGLEYFCSRGDALWNLDDRELAQLASAELEHIGLARHAECTDAYVVRVPDAYPVYDGAYRTHRQTIRTWLEDTVPNLRPIGRGGLHNYNSQDHAMTTALIAVGNALHGRTDDQWAVNTDEEYAEDSSRRSVAQRLPRSSVPSSPNRG